MYWQQLADWQVTVDKSFSFTECEKCEKSRFICGVVTLQLNMCRNRGLVQYFSPYISADLAKMAVSFNTTIPNLVSNLLTEKFELDIVSFRKMS